MSKTREAFQGVMVGRLVQGDCFEPQTKDQQGNTRVYKSGPNVGQPNPQFFIAVAYRKDDPNWPAFMAMLHRTAMAEWPALFNAAVPIANVFGIGAIPSVNPLFTFKVKDGDGIDRNGKSNADKEGFAGHWIVSYASAYAPKVVRPTSPGVWEGITWTAGTDKPIKRGFYIRVAGSITGNDSPNTPGLYVNLDMIELVGGGQEIVGGPDAATAFAAPVALPPGATPLMAGGVALPPPGAAPPAPGAVAAPPPPVTAALAPPPPAAGPVMLPAAGATTYDQFKQAGWTDEQLIAAGNMAPPAAPAATPAPPPAAGAAPPPPAAGGVPAPYGGHMGNGAVAPVAGVTPPPPSASGATASPTKAMTALANGATYDSFIAGGWSDAQLIASGYMTA